MSKARGGFPQPWHPAPYDEDIVNALQAVANGVAVAGQQTLALKWIVETACGTYDETYFADSERNTAYAQGKRHVGLQIVKMVKVQPDSLRKRQPK